VSVGWVKDLPWLFKKACDLGADLGILGILGILGTLTWVTWESLSSDLGDLGPRSKPRSSRS
jgi:hypothetical protein